MGKMPKKTARTLFSEVLKITGFYRGIIKISYRNVRERLWKMNLLLNALLR